jgi:hypothetical protein
VPGHDDDWHVDCDDERDDERVEQQRILRALQGTATC